MFSHIFHISGQNIECAPAHSGACGGRLRYHHCTPQCAFSQRAIDSRYHLYYIEETPLYISSYSLTGTTPGPPTVTSAFLLQSYLLHLCSQVPRSQWASLSVRTTYAYSSFSTHLTGLSTMKLQNIIATEVLFVKVFREFSENLKRPHQKGISKAE